MNKLMKLGFKTYSRKRIRYRPMFVFLEIVSTTTPVLSEHMGGQKELRKRLLDFLVPLLLKRTCLLLVFYFHNDCLSYPLSIELPCP